MGGCCSLAMACPEARRSSSLSQLLAADHVFLLPNYHQCGHDKPDGLFRQKDRDQACIEP